MTDLTEEEGEVLTQILLSRDTIDNVFDRIYELEECEYTLRWTTMPTNNARSNLFKAYILLSHYISTHMEYEANIDVSTAISDILNDIIKLNKICQDIGICDFDLVTARVSCSEYFEPGLEIFETKKIEYLPYSCLEFVDENGHVPRNNLIGHIWNVIDHSLEIRMTYRSYHGNLLPPVFQLKRPVMATSKLKLERWFELLLRTCRPDPELVDKLSSLLEKLAAKLDE